MCLGMLIFSLCCVGNVYANRSEVEEVENVHQVSPKKSWPTMVPSGISSTMAKSTFGDVSQLKFSPNKTLLQTQQSSVRGSPR